MHKGVPHPRVRREGVTGVDPLKELPERELEIIGIFKGLHFLAPAAPESIVE
jgi:hypothetical protein